MGTCASQTEVTAEESERSKAIEKQIRLDKDALETAKQTVKLLLLGAGDTGKSTVLKQMKLMYGLGFSKEERALFRCAIRQNIILHLQELVHQMELLKIPYGFDPAAADLQVEEEQARDREGINSANPPSMHSIESSGPNPSASIRGSWSSELSKKGKGSFLSANRIDDPIVKQAKASYINNGPSIFGHNCECLKAAHIIKELVAASDGNLALSPRQAEAIKLFWVDKGVQFCFKICIRRQIPESCTYFLHNFEKYFDPSYEITNDDALLVRITTTCVVETKFLVNGVRMSVFDVGGQRNERRKWASYFDDVTAIMFVAALSSYDQVCFEDDKTNRMLESMNLFASICNHPVFKRTTVILFLNKIDLFKEKLKVTPIEFYLPEFTGKNEYESAANYFKQSFINLNKYPEKLLYVYFTWATDSKQIQKVMSSVKESILQTKFSSLGLL